ncbi:Pectate lyase [Planctomycetales bacterium 10988]|nr:Pectate lyase [Planctomycetales bacterium 10988]
MTTYRLVLSVFVGVLLSATCLLEGTSATELLQPTHGGRGGQIVKVTNLQASGRGSLRDALWKKGPRIIVFEVGGVIDLEGKSLAVSEPYVTIAGQTAPSPGITLIKGGLSIKTHDVIVQHLKVRPGEGGQPKESGWEFDSISTYCAHHVWVDHCSCTWSTDENLSASGPRFEGETAEEWRSNTSHHISFTNNLVAEALSNSTHSEGEHSKGTLLHDNTSFITIARNAYISNHDRNPYAKGGVSALILNNWVFNPRSKAVSHSLGEKDWGNHAKQTSQLAIIGNVFEHGPDTIPNAPLLRNYAGILEAYLSDNLILTRKKRSPVVADGEPFEELRSPPQWIAGIMPLEASKVKESLIEEVGARPWDRDPIDARILREALAGKAKIIDSETEVEGYPNQQPTTTPFQLEDWNLETMQRR